MVQIQNYKESKGKYNFDLCIPAKLGCEKKNNIKYNIDKTFLFSDKDIGFTKIFIYKFYRKSNYFKDTKYIDVVREVFLSREFLEISNLDKLNKFIFNDSNKKIFIIKYKTICLNDNISKHDMEKVVCFLDNNFRKKIHLSDIENNKIKNKSCNLFSKSKLLETLLIIFGTILFFLIFSSIMGYIYKKKKEN